METELDRFSESMTRVAEVTEDDTLRGIWEALGYLSRQLSGHLNEIALEEEPALAQMPAQRTNYLFRWRDDRLVFQRPPAPVLGRDEALDLLHALADALDVDMNPA